MEMSPQRVRSAEFKSVRKGADPAEVTAFLNDVADELERAQNQSTAMEARARAAVARLQEMSEQSAASSEAPAPVAPVAASVEEADTISRTLLLAQRTADTAVAEARAEAARITRAANDEAATTLDSTREMSAQLLNEARTDARVAGESERVAVQSAVESLKARRDFLESDVEQLEIFLADQRNRIRESATSLLDITERVAGGLGETRPPLLSASDDDADVRTRSGVSADTTSRVPTDGHEADDASQDAGVATHEADHSGADHAGTDDGTDDDLHIVTDIADQPDRVVDLDDDPWADDRSAPTKAMPIVAAARDERSDGDDDDFRFSFDDDRV